MLNWLVVWMRQWHIGVSVFFVLSGFLITTRYAARIEPSWAWAKRYLQNRFARIYPIYFLLTITAFAIMAVWPRQEWYEWPAYYGVVHKAGALFFNLTLTRAFFHDLYLLGMPTAWSLTVEECFYISAPFLLLGLRGQYYRLLIYPFLALSIGAALVTACEQLTLPYGPMKNLHFMLNFTFFGRCAEFVAGMALALWLQRRGLRSQKGPWLTVLGSLGIVAFTWLVAWAQGPQAQLSSENWTYTQIFANNFILPLAVCLLFYGLLSEQSAFRRLLETKLFDLLGKSSYVFYLIHLGVFDTLFVTYISHNTWVRVLVYTLVSIALYKGIENPLHKRLQAKRV